MNKSRHSLYQLIQVLNKVEKGRSVIALGKADRLSATSFYHKEATYNDMYMNLLATRENLKTENEQLRKKYRQLQRQQNLLGETRQLKRVKLE